MTIISANTDLSRPISEWPVFYVDGEPYIYDDTDLFLDEDGEHMGQHPRHSELGIYLFNLLSWFYRGQLCTITFDLYMKVDVALKQLAAADAAQEKTAAARLTPDVALVKGVKRPDKATYVVGVDGPPPNVVFEVASESTFKEDLGNKLRLYAEAFAAKEYFLYDPHERRLWSGPRLKGWKLVRKNYVSLEPDARGRVWSKELQSWLVEDGAFLRLYAKNGQRRLTAEEVALLETQRADQIQAALEQERKRAEQAEARIKWLEEQLEKNE